MPFKNEVDSFANEFSNWNSSAAVELFQKLLLIFCDINRGRDFLHSTELADVFHPSNIMLPYVYSNHPHDAPRRKALDALGFRKSLYDILQCIDLIDPLPSELG
ncbi:MAG: hypothetical protein U1E10_12965, partial [Bdellovibrionales bacterium]|nr:hypothetical protein [Bdellovibrionales bacterium]